MSGLGMPTSESEWRRKLDARLIDLAEDAGESAEPVGVFVRFRGPPEQLARHGFAVGNVAGDIATATIALDELERAAGADEVVFIELSRPLGPLEESSPCEGFAEG
jgi:hypothetical protein